MADPELTIRKVDWWSLFPWLSLFRSVRIALMARVLLLGTIGLIATTLGWRALGWALSTNDRAVEGWNPYGSSWLWDGNDGIAMDIRGRSTVEVFRSARDGLLAAPIAMWQYLTAPFQYLFDGNVTAGRWFVTLLACIWEVLVWGLVGGAITRIAALKFTRDEALGPVAALRHSVSKLLSFSLAPLVALAGAAVFSIQLVLLGVLMNVGIFAMLISFVWPFVLLLGLLMAILLVGALIGWPLMWATVSVEGTDAFDALSRSYAYTYQRPWRLLWYVGFSLFLAAVSMFAVKVFAISAIRLGDWSVSWGAKDDVMHKVVAPVKEKEETNIAPRLGPDGIPTTIDTTDVPTATGPTGPNAIAQKCINFWKFLWRALAAGYQAGFLWVSAVGIYLLLRRDIDGAEMDEVFVEQEAEFGMPALDDDAATGVPEVSTTRPAQSGDAGAAGQPSPGGI